MLWSLQHLGAQELSQGLLGDPVALSEKQGYVHFLSG